MFLIDKSITIAYPGAKMGILIMKEVAYASSYDEAETTQAIKELHRKYSHLDRQQLKELYPVKAYAAYYRGFGSNYHLLAQLESVLKGKKARHSESGLLQAMFLWELDSMLLTAGHDLSQLELPLQLTCATGTETYQGISGKEVSTVKGDIMLCDGGGTVSSILRGPDYQSRITATTTEVLFSIYAPPGIEGEYIKKGLGKLEKAIRNITPSAKTELLQVFDKIDDSEI